MKLSITTSPHGQTQIEFPQGIEAFQLEFEIEPHHKRFPHHVAANVELDEFTFTGRLVRTDMALVVKVMPRETWDLIEETLEMDSNARNFDQALRENISLALATIQELNPPVLT